MKFVTFSNVQRLVLETSKNSDFQQTSFSGAKCRFLVLSITIFFAARITKPIAEQDL